MFPLNGAVCCLNGVGSSILVMVAAADWAYEMHAESNSTSAVHPGG